MLRIIAVLLFLIVLVVGIPFSAFNSDPVSVYYFLDSSAWPLSLVLVFAFSLGVLVTTLICLSVLLPLRWRLSRLQDAVVEQRNEIGALRKRSDQKLRQA